MYDEIVSILGTPPTGFEWLVYLLGGVLLLYVFANALRMISFILGGGRS